MSLIEKIDMLFETVNINDNEFINHGKDKFNMALIMVKEFILSEQKEPDATDTNVVGKIITIGDKIRESNESLASYIEAIVAIALGDTSFIDVERRINYLNQPYTTQSTTSPHQSTAK